MVSPSAPLPQVLDGLTPFADKEPYEVMRNLHVFLSRGWNLRVEGGPSEGCPPQKRISF